MQQQSGPSEYVTRQEDGERCGDHKNHSLPAANAANGPLRPQTPWPEVQPEPSRVPTPTSKPAAKASGRVLEVQRQAAARRA